MRRKSFNGLIYDFTQKFKRNTAFKYRPAHDLEKEKYKKYVTRNFTELYEDILKTNVFFQNNEINNYRVAILGRNSYIWSLVMLTASITDNIIVPIDKELKYEETLSSLKRSGADIVFYDEKFSENVLKACEDLNIKHIPFDKIKEHIFNKNLKFNFEKENKKYIEIMEEKEKEYELYEVENSHEATKYSEKNFEKDVESLEDVKVMLFTSGTTAMSKLVLITRENLITNIYDICDHVNFSDKNTEIALLPAHHIFGLTCIFVMKHSGINTTYPDSLKQIGNNLKEYKVSLFVGVPLILEAIYARVKKTAQDSKKWNLLTILRKFSNFLMFFGIDKRRKLFKSVLEPLGGNLQYIISGAAALNPEVANFFNDIGVRVYPGYGLSETSPVVAAENPDHKKNGSVGVKVKNVEIKIDNKSLIEHYENTLDLSKKENLKIIEKLKNSKEGEILVRGKSVFKGYYKDLEKTKESFYKTTHWFKTGDIGYLDKDNYLFITGRMKDMIVLGNGKKAFPDELEYLINDIDDVIDSFVFATDKNIGFGTNNELRIYAKVQYDASSENFKDKTEEEIYDIIWAKIKKINKTLPPYKYIRGLLLTKEGFVKTTTKKTKRFIEKEKIEKEFSDN